VSVAGGGRRLAGGDRGAADQLNLADVDEVPPFPVLWDLVVDGELVTTVREEVGSRYDPIVDAVVERADSPAVIRFDDLAPGVKHVEIWLPLRSSVTVQQVLVDGGATAVEAENCQPRWVVHGSSITHCAEAISPARSWPAHAARIADLDLLSLGMGGNCLVEQWLARAIRDTRADLITLKLGVNVWNLAAMRERSFVSAVHGFLDTVRDGHPETPITVVSPIYCPGGEDTPGPSEVDDEGRYVGRGSVDDPGALSIGRMRELLDGLVALRRELGDQGLTYLDGRSLLGPGDSAHLPDDLHPDGDGYLLMGERYAALALG
jgi:GDSL-like Lipase/Acylhydrolase family